MHLFLLLSLLLTYFVVRMTIPARLAELGRALTPPLLLNGLLFAAATALHFSIAGLAQRMPFAYLAAMGLLGGAVYAAAFFLLPIPELRGEAERWRNLGLAALQKVGLARK